MALLALTSQELPASRRPADLDPDSLDLDRLSTEQTLALHDYLDANPAAFEEFLLRHRRSPPPASVPLLRRSLARRLATLLGWFESLRPAPRYALALSVAAVFAVLVSRSLLREPQTLTASIDAAYADAASSIDSAAVANLTLPWELSGDALGFAPAAANSAAHRVSFAQGLLAGKNSLAEAPASNDATIAQEASSAYFALGEWNVLLWASSESGSMPQTSGNRSSSCSGDLRQTWRQMRTRMLL